MNKIFLLAAVLSIQNLAFSKPIAKKVSIGIIFEHRKQGMVNSNFNSFVELALKQALDENSSKLKEIGIEISTINFEHTEEPITAYSALQRAIDANTVASIGITRSKDAMVAAKLLKPNDYMLISPYATSTDLLSYSPHFLMLGSPGELQAKAIGRFLKEEIKPKRIASVIAWDRPYVRSIWDAMDPEFKEDSRLWKVLNEIKNEKKIAKEIISYDPDVVFSPNFPITTAAIIRELVKLGFKGKIVGADGWDENKNARFYGLTKDIKFDGYAVRQYSKLNQSKMVLELQKKLSSHRPMIPTDEFTIISALYYDSFKYLISLIIELGEKTSRKSLLDLAKKTPTYKGIVGKSCFFTIECTGVEFSIIKFGTGVPKFYKSIKI